MEKRPADKSTLRRIWERFTGATARWWLLTAALLGAGMLPCPECGTPVIFHIWPIAGLLLVVRALKRRYRDASPAEKDREEGFDTEPVDQRQ
jgi:hypothetical protein